MARWSSPWSPWPGARAAAGGGGSVLSSGRGSGAQGRSGGTLAVALLDPGPLDPARADGLEDEIVLGNLFDGLTTIDPAGAVRPAVAASWSSDPDLRRWEFRLRPDARWSDGSRSAPTSPSPGSAWPTPRRQAAVPRPRPGPARGRHRLPGVRRRPLPLSPAWRSPTRPPWSSASTAPSPTSRPWSPPSRCRRSPPLWPAPTRPPTWPARSATAPSAWPPRPGPAAPSPSTATPPTRAHRPCSTRSASTGPRRADRLAGAPERPGRVRPRPLRPARRRPHRPRPLRRRPHPARPPPGPHPHHLEPHLQPEVEARRQQDLAPGRLPRHRPRPTRHRPGRHARDRPGSPGHPGWTSGAGADPACTVCGHDPAKARALLAKAKTGRAPVTMAIPPVPTPAASPPWSPAT